MAKDENYYPHWMGLMGNSISLHIQHKFFYQFDHGLALHYIHPAERLFRCAAWIHRSLESAK